LAQASGRQHTLTARCAQPMRCHRLPCMMPCALLAAQVNEIIILYSDATDMHERARVEKSNFDSLELARSTFSYMMLDEGIFARRQLSCWCVPCFGSRGRGAGTTDSNLVCSGCCRAGNAQREWHEQECQRTDALGIAERRMAAQREGHRLGGRLEPAMWLAAQDRLTGQTLYIGQGVKVPGAKPGGLCIHTKVTGRTEKIKGTQFERNDWVLAVKWWTKTGDDPEERTYEEWEPTQEDIAACGIETADGVYFLLNSTELRHINFPMDAVDPLPTAPVPVAARTRRSSAEAERPSTTGRRFRLPADVEGCLAC
jgi:hypothetical protein